MGWVVGGIITWTLALTPVLTLRYVVLKRPIGKWPAVGLGALTSVVHVVVFALLGATKLGPVSAVVGFVAYGILRAGNGSRQKKQTAHGEADDASRAGDAATGLYAEGCRLADAGEHAAAIEVFAKCTGADPKNADAWHNRGCSLYELGRHSEATDSFSQALALRPEDSTTLFARGLAREASGEYADAIADFERYVSGSGALAGDKIVYAKNAIDDARRHLTSSAANARPISATSSVLPATEPPEFPSGMLHTDECGERAVIVRHNGGLLRMSVRDFLDSVKSGQVSGDAEAMSTFLFGDGRWHRIDQTRSWRSTRGATTRATPSRKASNPTRPVTLQAPSTPPRELIRVTDDVDDAKRLLFTDPGVWLRKGLDLMGRREWRDAATCLSRAMALKPNDPDVLFALAQVEEALGANDSARKHFGDFLVYAPSDDSCRIAAAQRRLRNATK